MQEGDLFRSRSPARYVRNEIFQKFDLKENPNTITADPAHAAREYYSRHKNQAERFNASSTGLQESLLVTQEHLRQSQGGLRETQKMAPMGYSPKKGQN